MGAIVQVPFYPSDWLAGTRGMSAAETGVYITLIAMIYERAGPIEAHDIAKLARLCGTSASALKGILDRLASEGKITVTGGMISNKRAEIEIEKVGKKSAVAKHAINERWRKSATNSKASGYGRNTDVSKANIRPQNEGELDQNENIARATFDFENENGEAGGEKKAIKSTQAGYERKPDVIPAISHKKKETESSHGIEAVTARAEPPDRAMPGHADQDRKKGQNSGQQLDAGDRLEATCRQVVASINPSEPVMLALDFEEFRRALPDGWTQADVEAGIRAAMAKTETRFRRWGAFAGWVRGAMQDRMGQATRPNAGKAAAPQTGADEEPRLTLPGGFSWPVTSVIAAIRRHASNPTDWPTIALGPAPGEPGCRIPKTILDQASA